MGRRVKEFVREASKRKRRGEISEQQAKTLIGQAKSGDYDGAMRGLKRLCERMVENDGQTSDMA